MEALELRNLISEYISTADERLLRMVKAIMESYHEEEFNLSEKHYEILDERKELHENGESQSFTWQEVVQNARNATN